MRPIDLTADPNDAHPKIQRLNRLPIFIVIGFAVVFLSVVIWGLSQRGLIRGGNRPDQTQGQSASNFADEIKRGIGDGVIDEPRRDPVIPATNTAADDDRPAANPFRPSIPQKPDQQTMLEPKDDWRQHLLREHEEALLREKHRQRLAALQAQSNARNSPVAVDITKLEKIATSSQQAAGQRQGQGQGQMTSPFGSSAGMADLYAATMRASVEGQQGMTNLNNQAGKQAFFNQDVAELGYLPNRVVPQMSPYELKRGSVIPATLVTGINSDLPGRITAQVRQNVYDSATGHRLLIPQGAKLLGRYDSEVSFGQKRVLAIWTDIIFPNGSTLQIGGMAGVDAQGYGGFHDKVNNHFWRTFGSAILVAAIGTGIDMALPDSGANTFGISQNRPEDAARRNFAETFGRVAGKTIDRNLNVQPTLEIRPGYNFNILVDQDVVFPDAYRSRRH